jgi:hypothetical protein
MALVTKVRSLLTFPNVAAATAGFLVLAGGTAYAANEWTGNNIVNGSLTGADLATGTVASVDIQNGAVTSADILNATVVGPDIAANAIGSGKVIDSSLTSADLLDETIAAIDIAPDAVGASEIQTDGVNATEIADNSIDSGEIVDFGLSNEDIGVLWAQVNGDGTVFAHSGGVTAIKLGTGTYEVDFGRDVSSCAGLSSQGEGSTGGAPGALIGVTDRSGNLEAFFVTVRTDANALVDRAFQILVAC